MAAITTDVAAFTKLVGDTLLRGEESVSTADALKGKDCVAIYFSAHWCGPCRGFTPSFADAYNKLKAAGKKFEVVFVSSDRDEDAFKEYFGEMPWLALPYTRRDLKQKLSSKFKVSGIPSLVLLDSSGKCYNMNGRSAVSDLESYPWQPRKLSEILGDDLMNKVSGKTFGIYFSAHWCPPCRGFTPKLVENYKKLKEAGKDFEIIFVSSDRGEDAFNEYFGEMPWLALPFSKRKEKSELSEMFGVQGIPTLVVVGSDGKTITTEGRGPISSATFVEDFPYYPKPVNDLDDVQSGINEYPSLLVITQGAEESDHKAAHEVLLKAAEDMFKKEEDDREVGRFFTVKGDMAERLRGMMDIPSKGICMVMLDIASQGAYYLPSKPVTSVPSADDVKAFISDFKEGKVDRKQLN